MHYVLEIIMPQVEDVELAVDQIMTPFSENCDDEDRMPNPFWDFWVIGGRWAGHKLESGLDQDKLSAFRSELNKRNVTVSGLQCGKQELQPEDQIPMVDALWTEYFPEYNGRACPLFKHANDQYTNDCLYGDVLRVKDTPPSVTAGRVIIANYDYQDALLEAKFMLSTDVWNGVNHEDTAWDGKITTALEMYDKSIQNYKEEYREKNKVTDDMLVVTVDYHS